MYSLRKLLKQNLWFSGINPSQVSVPCPPILTIWLLPHWSSFSSLKTALLLWFLSRRSYPKSSHCQFLQTSHVSFKFHISETFYCQPYEKTYQILPVYYLISLTVWYFPVHAFIYSGLSSLKKVKFHKSRDLFCLVHC